MGSLRSAFLSAVEHLLGSPYSHKLSYNLARIGMRGLGVGLPPLPKQNGEYFFLSSFFSSCGASGAIDVGGNVGDYTDMLLDLGAEQVITFEPVPASAEYIAQRFKSDNRVTLRRQAVGESVNTIRLNVPSDSATSVLASRGAGAAAFTAAPMNLIDVPMTTLDAAIAELSVMPDFLKIDVEGFEAEVLAGAQQLVASRCLKAIQFEFSYHHLLRGTTLIDFERYLPDYKLYRVASRALRPLDSRHYLGTIYGFSNIVALRADIAEKLKAII
jgi:FkbM family methyltransferase